MATSINTIVKTISHQATTSKSDIDLLVELEPGRSLFDLGGLLMDMQDLLGQNVDVVTERGLRERIRKRVLKEAVPLRTRASRSETQY